MRQARLLIVDDELSNLQKLRRTFVEDFQIQQALSGEEALGLIGRQPFEVIITDQKMPGMTGVELLSRSLIACPESIRIILTGYTEVDYLMDAINQGQVHRYITKPWEPFALRQTVLQDLEHFRLKRENHLLEEQLRIARQVQRHLFPQTLPPLGGLDYSGICRSAGQVGGDYYDFLKLSDHLLCLAIGDISGKGISAALLMASLQALFRSHVPHRKQALSEMLSTINRLLCSLTDGSKFATFFCAVYDDSTRQLTWVNAGHNPPLIWRRGAPAESAENPLFLQASGTFLGMFLDAVYEQRVCRLEPGDVLLLYTDGVTEAHDREGSEFGESRLIESLRRHAELPSRELQDAIVQDVLDFAGDDPLEDDLTLVVAKAR